MSNQELSSRDKVLNKMSRDGLVQENLTQGTAERISERDEDFSLKEEGTLEEKFKRSRGPYNTTENASSAQKWNKGSNPKGSHLDEIRGGKYSKTRYKSNIKYSDSIGKVVVKQTKTGAVFHEKNMVRSAKGAKRLADSKARSKTFEEEQNVVALKAVHKGYYFYRTLKNVVKNKGLKNKIRNQGQKLKFKIESKVFEEEDNVSALKASHEWNRLKKVLKPSLMRNAKLIATKTYELADYAWTKFQQNHNLGDISKKKYQQKQMQKKRQQKKRQTQRVAEQVKQQFRNIAQETKKAAAKMAEVIKEHKRTIAVILIIVLIFYSIMLMFSSCAAILGEMGVDIGGSFIGGVYQTGWDSMSECDAYYKEKETDLDWRIQHIEEEFPGYDEYIYNLGTIGHSQTKLLSYLATVYTDFTLDKCQSELDNIFNLMYKLTIEEKIETRQKGTGTYDKSGNEIMMDYEYKMLYITLEVKDLDEVLRELLGEDEAKLNQYDLYTETGGGQQVFSNPFDFDWSNDISSYYGWRIHPVDGVKKFHGGIDIAEPEGTPIKAVMSGTVITATYSDSAGNYIAIQDEDGYVSKYMHCSVLNVSVGQTVLRGDVIGAVGTTGKSTGNHLHLQIEDSEGNTLNPLFMVTSNYSVKE